MNCLLVMKIKWSLDINTGAVERSEAARARRLAGATVVGPVTAQADQLWHAETGPPCARTTIPNPDHYKQRAFLGMLVRGTNIPGDFGPPDQNNGDRTSEIVALDNVSATELSFPCTCRILS